MSARQCPRCHCVNDSMTEVAGDLHCLACGHVADVPMEAWDECEAQKDARIAEMEETLTLAYRLALQDAWQDLRELLAERATL